MRMLDTVILDNGALAIIKEREAIATLKRISDDMHMPLVRYVGKAKVVEGALAGTVMHTVQLPAGNILCYPCSDDNTETPAAKKYRITARRRSADGAEI